jgi:threonine-phosphate decarboxylase
MLYQTKNLHGGDIYGGKVELDFSANTNPFGTPQGIIDAVCSALPEMHRYPDPYCRKLTQAISNFEEVSREYILCGNGAADLIYAYCEAVRPKLAVELAPTFSEYALGLKRVGSRVERYYLRQENEFELGEGFLPYLTETKPDAVFLCNPNNPTGKTIAPSLLEKILAFCASNGIRLFVDECFLDLSDSGESLKPMLAQFPNLFILKAFTKSYGMAGIRLGYCMCSDSELLEQMSQSAQPWNVSSVAQAAGVAALQEHAFLEKTKELIVTERQWMKEKLEDCGFQVYPSSANYLLFLADADLHTKLKEKKIAIRNCDNYIGLGSGWYRIAVRLHEENEILIRAIKEV